MRSAIVCRALRIHAGNGSARLQRHRRKSKGGRSAALRFIIATDDTCDVTYFVIERGGVIFGRVERRDRRHADDVAAGDVTGDVTRCDAGDLKLLEPGFMGGDRQQLDGGRRWVKSRGQIVDLVGGEDDVPLQEPEGVLDFGAALVEALALALPVIDDDLAAFAFAHMSAQLHSLIEGQPIGRSIAALHRGAPKDDDVHAAIVFASGAARQHKAGACAIPRLAPWQHALVEFVQNLRRDVGGNVAARAIAHGLRVHENCSGKSCAAGVTGGAKVD